MSKWHVYILECNDRSLYTGITNDIDARIKKHKEGHGAKYTRSHGVKKLIYTEDYKTRSAATKREREIKDLKRTEKLEMIKTAKRRKEKPQQA